ncbi:hypothetical protein UlMin_033346 [Ulmus minor]
MRPPRGSGSRRGAHGGGAGRGGFRNEGPPKQVVEVSTFLHACEGDAVTKLTQEKIPYFNLSSLFSIKMMEGIVATSYSGGDKFYINPEKLLPLARFLPQGGHGGGFRRGGGGFRQRDAPRGRGVPPRGGRGSGFRGRGRC